MVRASFPPFASLPIVAALAAGAAGCGQSGSASDDGLRLLGDHGIDQIAFIHRSKRVDGVGDVFQYTSFSVEFGSANIMRMASVSGGADVEAITPFGQGAWPRADIMAMDVSFDGQELVFSAQLEGEDTYDLYRIKTDGTNPEEPGNRGPALIHTGPYHSVYPIYLPGDRIFFMTNEAASVGVLQFRDEYERGVTAQAATIDKRGGDLRFGPRNLSHRVSPTLVSGADGRGQILHTNWDHLSSVNEGNLMVMNPDMTGAAEFYGKEGGGVANSYLKPRQINAAEYLAIATSRDRTFQAGSIIKVIRGESEALSTAEIITPDVPRDRIPSYDKIGRYYDAYPITSDGGTLTHVLTSWADGAVHTDVAMGGVSEDGTDYGQGSGPPDFGLYVLDPTTNRRLPLFNDPQMWDVMPLPIGSARAVPTAPAGATAQTPEGTALIGALNVFESSLPDAPSADVFRVRVIEGFSSEEGVPGDFGLTESDGAILLGEAPVEWKTDGSFAAFVPEDRPIHLQTLDGFGMRLVNEDRWFSSAPGEQRFCGGCHEQRGSTQVVAPGLSDAVGRGPTNLALPHGERRLGDAEQGDWSAMVGKLVFPTDGAFAAAPRVRGLPWDTAVQEVFDDAGCGTCHDGTPGPANPTVTLSDTMGEMASEVEWTFDLRGEPIEFEYGMMTGSYTRSHVSLLLLAGMNGEPGVTTMVDATHPYRAYVVPQSARDSILIKYIQPEQVYPVHDAGVVAFADEVDEVTGMGFAAAHPNPETPGFDAAVHRALRVEEKYLLVLMADLGGQFYALENAPGEAPAEGE